MLNQKTAHSWGRRLGSLSRDGHLRFAGKADAHSPCEERVSTSRATPSVAQTRAGVPKDIWLATATLRRLTSNRLKKARRAKAATFLRGTGRGTEREPLIRKATCQWLEAQTADIAPIAVAASYLHTLRLSSQPETTTFLGAPHRES